MDDRRLLGIYLNDHLTGSAVGRSLAQRISKSNGMEPARREGERLVAEIDTERRALVAIIRRLGLRPKLARTRVAPVLERVGRLKLNGSLLRRSPLSDLVELEGMSLGVNGKLRMWQALRLLAPGEPALDQAELDQAELDQAELDQAELDRMVEQAENQIGRLDALREEATTRAFRGA